MDEAQSKDVQAPSFPETRLFSLAQADLLRTVQLVVTVELGELKIAVDDLLDISQGATFEFERGEEQPLVLRIGEGKIGEARLVTVEGKLALEVISLNSE